MGMSLQQSKSLNTTRAPWRLELLHPFPTAPGLPGSGLFMPLSGRWDNLGCFPSDRIQRRFWTPLPEADLFLQTLPGFPTAGASQQTGAWFPLHPMALVSAGVVPRGEGSAQGSARRWVPSWHRHGCVRQGGCPAASAQAVPLCLPPVPGRAERWVGDSCSGIPVGPEQTRASWAAKGPGKAWRGDIPARCGEVTVPPTWVPGAGVTAGGDPSCVVCSWDWCCRAMKLQCWFQCLQGGGDPPG